MLYLQSVLEELVHLGHLGGDGEINGAVANLDNQAAADVRADLGHDLELLACADVLRLADGRLEAGEGLVVKGLRKSAFVHSGRKGGFLLGVGETYSSAGHDELELAAVGAHEDAKVLYNAL